MKGLPLVLLILTVGAVGCDESPTGPTELVDITWKLETVAHVGSALVTVPNPISSQYASRPTARCRCGGL
jgi:hypothetical protein